MDGQRDPEAPPEGVPAPQAGIPDEAEEDRSRAGRASEQAAKMMRRLRTILPGDPEFGGSPASSEQGPEALARRLADAASDRPSLLREAGLGALQVWQALGDNERARSGERELAVAFTDLVDFSNWALGAGDAAAVELLREVTDAVEPPIAAHGGTVVKRLGDGTMAVFADPSEAVEALLDGLERLGAVSADGYAPRIRAGIHLGFPRKVGGDYLGVDVNVAARIADAAKGDQILASEAVVERLDPARFGSRRKLMFRAKGVPSGITVYSIRRA